MSRPTNLGFLEELRVLTIERLKELTPKYNSLALVAGSDRYLAIKLRWLGECVRDNKSIYLLTTDILVKHGALYEVKSNQETMELFG